MNELDTYKFKKASFEEIWETSFLVSILPILTELIDFLKPEVPQSN